MANYETYPMSRQGIINYARHLRANLGIADVLYLPVVELFESFSTIFPDCTTEIVEDSDLPKNQHAATDIQRKIIRIKESVYDRACAGKGRDRMTIMHELAHYFLLVISSFQVTQVVGLREIASYKDPEWQAKALAAEMMIPYDLTRQMTSEDIAISCGVSLDSAKYQKTHSHDKNY